MREIIPLIMCLQPHVTPTILWQLRREVVGVALHSKSSDDVGLNTMMVTSTFARLNMCEYAQQLFDPQKLPRQLKTLRVMNPQQQIHRP